MPTDGTQVYETMCMLKLHNILWFSSPLWSCMWNYRGVGDLCCSDLVVTCSDLRSLHVVTYEIPCPRLVKVAVMCQKVRILSGDTWHSVVCKKKHVLELHCMLLPPEHTARRFMAPTPNISGPQNEIWSYFQKTWAPPTDLRSMRGFFFWLGTVI